MRITGYYKSSLKSLFIFIYLFYAVISVAQPKRIVVLGSSTAEGFGLVDGGTNGWVGKYRTYLQTLNAANEVINLGKAGFYTLNVLPTNLGGDPTRNITAALSFNPNIIIVNLPTNDAQNGVSVATYMERMRLLRQLATSAGVAFWVATTQPKNTELRIIDTLMRTRDSIIAQFPNRDIDFWTTVANPDGTINPLYGQGDGTHLNLDGHEILFQRTKAQPILNSTALPLELLSFKVLKQLNTVQVEWESVQNEPVKFEVEKSYDGLSFFKLLTILSSTNTTLYKTADSSILAKNNFYRLKAITGSRIKYSEVVRLFNVGQSNVMIVLSNPVRNGQINLQLKFAQETNLILTIQNTVGALILKKDIHGSLGIVSQTLQLPVMSAKGLYYLSIADGKTLYTEKLIVQ